MKKILLMILLLVIIAQARDVCAQTPPAIVRDPYVRLQLERMVFRRWGKFKPWWYFFFYHNKYRRGPDRRTIKQLSPTAVVLIQTKNKSEEEQDEVEKMYQMETWDALNRATESHYHLHFKPIFDRLNGEIDKLLDQCVAVNTDPAALMAFMEEKIRLNGEINIIRKGWLENGDSAEAMEEIEKDFRKLKADLDKFVWLQTINNRYQTLEP